MRKYDIAYVPNGPVNYYPSVPLQDMSLEEIKKKYIKCCAKANGDISVCSRCKTPCPEGKRAIQLLATTIYDDPPIPLYGGKTLIERAKEENMRRREAERLKEEAEKKEIVSKKGKDGRLYIEDWYEKAVASGDPVAWVMETFKFSKTKAKQKIYAWRNRHPETTKPVEDNFNQTEVNFNNVEVKPVEEKPTEVKPVEVKEEGIKETSIEAKLESLMRLQEEQKKIMEEHMRLYEKAKVKYGELKSKIDILCSAIDIINC